MGTYGTFPTRADALGTAEHLYFGESETYHVVDRHDGKRARFLLIQSEPDLDPDAPETFVAIFLAVPMDGGWGYKPMDEAMGPFEADCPVTWLDQLDPPRGFASKWRARVRAEGVRP